MTTNGQSNEIELLLKAGYKLIHFCSQEELRAREELVRVAGGGDGQRARECFIWKMTDGFCTPDRKAVAGAKDTDKPDKALQWIIERETKKCPPSLYIFKDCHSYLAARGGSAMVIRKLRDTVHFLEPTYSAIILLCPQLEIPPELEKEIVIVDFALPTVGELRQRFVEMINELPQSVNVELTDAERGVNTKDAGITELAKAAQGLTLTEAELALGKAITREKVQNGQQVKRLDLGDAHAIVEEKKQIVRKTGILTFEEPGQMEDVGGLEQLKAWLKKRRNIFSEDARRYGLLAPKGVLLTGVPGCGKSLCAKAMASYWGVPILRLDMGAVYGGLVGQSEANMRKAIKCAEAMAPCILMVDEIEKGLAGSSGGGGDGGTSTRVFGTLLSWMSDKTAQVFVVATANEFDRLPPELLRKGRFDEIFFVDFPHAGEREQIFQIHVKKAVQRRDPAPTDEEQKSLITSFGFTNEYEVRRSKKTGQTETARGTMVQLSKDFTGSEIEEAVKTAMIDAFADNKRPFSAEDIARAIAQTVPLIDTMSDKIEALRARARECTVSASKFPEGEEEAQVVATEPEPPQPQADSTPQPPSRGGRRMFDLS
jgi:SpoVK/Ycf46/Vps4 family AAA+-type ATPase